MIEEGADRNLAKLNLARGNLLVASELLRKGSLPGMAEASRLLESAFKAIESEARQGSVVSEEWKEAEEIFYQLSARYFERALEICPRNFFTNNKPTISEVG